MSDTCKAAWNGGRCDRPASAARGLCQGHYAQWRRQTDSGEKANQAAYLPLRDASGAGEGRHVPVTVHVPQPEANQYKQAAKSAGLGVSELLRPWLQRGFEAHQKRQRRRT